MWSVKSPILRTTRAWPVHSGASIQQVAVLATNATTCCSQSDAASQSRWAKGFSSLASSIQRPFRDRQRMGLPSGQHRHSGGGMAGCGAVASFATGAGPASASAGATSRPGPRVCILGGGFGGLYTAVRLDALLWPQDTKPQVTLIDQSERFVFKPLLYDYVAGTAKAWEVAPYFQQLLAPYNINFVQGSVSAVEPDELSAEGGSATGGRVTLADGQSVEYDWLVLALGSESSTFGIPGAKELAVPFCTYDDAVKAKERLQALQNHTGTPEVVVVGAGYAGIELASVAAEMLAGHGRVKLVTADPDILSGSPPGQRSAARSVLTGKNITVVTNGMVSSIKRVGGDVHHEIEEPDTAPRMVYLKMPDGSQQLLQADLVLWTAGSQPASRGADNGSRKQRGLSLPFKLNGRGATETDNTLRVLSHSRVFALGDVSGVNVPDTDSLPVTAQVAFQQADYVAWNLWASINGRPLLPFRYQHLGDMMSLGAVNGAVTLPVHLPPPLAGMLQGGLLGSLAGAAGLKVDDSDDRRRVTLDGPLAGALRRAAYWYRQPTNEQRLRVGASWLEQFAEEGAKAAQSVLSGRPPFPRT